MARSGISLKYKLLALLTIIPIVALGIYAFVAIDLFREDKVAYVYDSSATISSSLASQVRAEINILSSSLRPFIATYDPVEKNFSDSGQAAFQQDQAIDFLGVYHVGATNFLKGGQLAKFKTEGSWIEGALGQELVRRADEEEFVIKGLGEDKIVLSFRNGQLGDPSRSIVLSIINSGNLKAGLVKRSSYKNFLVGPGGDVLFGVDANYKFAGWEFFQDMQKSGYSARTIETLSPQKENTLVSYAKVGVGGLVVVSLVKKEDALVAVRLLLTKSTLFFIAIISASFIISILASGQITSALRNLFVATQSVAEGNYSVDIQVKSRDEVGQLAQSFKTMASEVSRLMTENVDKARMEKELETAKAVQDALFPSTSGDLEGVQVEGYYTSASECGGDWWHYCELGDKIFLWIGDATGHGAPAALITSAAKSVASVVESIEDATPASAMTMLNRSIFKNSRGKICMTFFIASLDRKTGELTYCNASHEPPIKIPHNDGEPVKKMHLEPIISESFARLGEKLESEYKDEKIVLEKGDIIYFYTDGVTELVGPDGSMFEERRLLRSIVAGLKQGEGIKGLMSKLDSDLEEFREGTPYEDDVTYFVAQYT